MGFRRGILNVLDVRRRFTGGGSGGGELGYLYDNGINPIRFASGRGILIWGNKTLSSRPSALDRLNVRFMLVTIEPAIKRTLEDNFLFELNTLVNDVGTRSRVRIVIEEYMKGIKARGGVYDFQVICDETNNTPSDVDNYILNVWLLVKPTRSIEYINLTVGILSTGIEFSVAADLVV